MRHIQGFVRWWDDLDSSTLRQWCHGREWNKLKISMQMTCSSPPKLLLRQEAKFNIQNHQLAPLLSTDVCVSSVSHRHGCHTMWATAQFNLAVFFFSRSLRLVIFSQIKTLLAEVSSPSLIKYSDENSLLVEESLPHYTYLKFNVNDDCENKINISHSTLSAHRSCGAVEMGKTTLRWSLTFSLCLLRRDDFAAFQQSREWSSS